MSKQNRCAECRRYKELYVLGRNKFSSTGLGKCAANKSIVKAHESCGRFAPDPYRKNISKLIEFDLNFILLQLGFIRDAVERGLGNEEKV